MKNQIHSIEEDAHIRFKFKGRRYIIREKTVLWFFLYGLQGLCLAGSFYAFTVFMFLLG